MVVIMEPIIENYTDVENFLVTAVSNGQYCKPINGFPPITLKDKSGQTRLDPVIRGWVNIDTGETIELIFKDDARTPKLFGIKYVF